MKVCLREDLVGKPWQPGGGGGTPGTPLLPQTQKSKSLGYKEGVGRTLSVPIPVGMLFPEK